MEDNRMLRLRLELEGVYGFFHDFLVLKVDENCPVFFLGEGVMRR